MNLWNAPRRGPNRNFQSQIDQAGFHIGLADTSGGQLPGFGFALHRRKRKHGMGMSGQDDFLHQRHAYDGRSPAQAIPSSHSCYKSYAIAALVR
jgi:hypothetical protein